MRTSNYLLSTLKESPAEAVLESHKLMVRAGYIRKLASGLYTWLPTGLAVLKKVEDIIRDEMAKAGCVELLMPFVQPADLLEGVRTLDPLRPGALPLQGPPQC